jgi:hypothetical protein
MSIACGRQMLCNMTGIAGLAVVDNANLHCDTIERVTKKDIRKNIPHGKTAWNNLTI